MASDKIAVWTKAGLIGLFTFAVYAYTTPMGLTWDLGGADGGELATAVHTRGLVHSPGYPTYLITAQITHLFSFTESVAYRLNLFSALCMSIATAVLASLCQKINKDSISFLIPLVFAFMPLVWSQAIIGEVYALAALFCTILLHASILLREEKGQKKAFLIGILLGAGLGAHYMIIFPIIFLLIYTQSEKNHWLKINTAGITFSLLAGTIVGLLVFLYLPIQAGNAPLSNWGNPNSLPRFWWVVSGAAYYGRFKITLIPIFAPSVLATIIQGIGLVGSILAAWGLTGWWEQQRSLFLAATFMIIANIALVSGYNSADVLPYLYPSILLLVVAMAQGVKQIQHQLQASNYAARTQHTLTGILMLAALAPVAWAGLETVQSASTSADIYGQSVITQLEPNSILFTQGTDKSFALRYATAVSHPEKGVIAIDTDLWSGQAWYRADLRTFPPIQHLPKKKNQHKHSYPICTQVTTRCTARQIKSFYHHH